MILFFLSFLSFLSFQEELKDLLLVAAISRVSPSVFEERAHTVRGPSPPVWRRKIRFDSLVALLEDDSAPVAQCCACDGSRAREFE